MSDAQWRRTWTALAVVGLGLYFAWAVVTRNEQYALLLRQAVTGLGTGAIASMSGVGLVLTYQVTGVFNFAFGAIATFVAFFFWEAATSWGFPTWAAGLFAILVIGPLLGVALDVAVYRPLQRRGGSTSEKLLATIAVFALLIGVCALIWGLGSKTDVPALFGSSALFRVGTGFFVGSATIGQLAVAVVGALGITAMLRYTRLGTQMRAVVDRRQLAELAGVRANRVSMIAWALGCGFAGIVGILYAPVGGLSPYSVTLLVLDTFSVAAIARLTNMWLAVAGGLAIGVVQSVGTVLPVTNVWPGFGGVIPNLFAISLALFLFVYRNLDELGTESSARGLVTGAIGRRRDRTRLVGPGAAVAVIAVVLGLVLRGNNLATAQQVLALSVIFLSIVAITGFSGHITLGTAGFAGLGAFVATKVANGAFPGLPKLPVIVATLIAGVVVAALGLATGYPALRRKGLILGLMTLAVGLLLYYLIFEQVYFGKSLYVSARPSLFGLSLNGDRAFYLYELAWVGVALVLASNIRSGPLGRVLAAMRDSEVGAVATGINLRRYKLFVFAASSFLAGIGGALLAQQQTTFNAEAFSPLISLFWFLAVVFCGLSYLSGAVTAAAIYAILDSALHTDNGSVVVIGLLALVSIWLGWRGGLVGTGLRLAGGRGVPPGLAREYAEQAAPPRPARAYAGNGRPAPATVPTAAGRAAMARAAASRPPAGNPSGNGHRPAYAPSEAARRLLQGEPR